MMSFKDHLAEASSNYDLSRGDDPEHDILLQLLQENECREFIATAADGDAVVNAFTRAGNAGHVDILQAFFNHGMNADIKHPLHGTALIHASLNFKQEAVRVLLDHNANIDATNGRGETALMCASSNGCSEVVELLLKRNANLDLQNEYGETALMEASRFGHKEIVQSLLDHNANVELKNKKGATALDVARKEQIKKLLRNHVPPYVLK